MVGCLVISSFLQFAPHYGEQLPNKKGLISGWSKEGGWREKEPAQNYFLQILNFMFLFRWVLRSLKGYS